MLSSRNKSTKVTAAGETSAVILTPAQAKKDSMLDSDLRTLLSPTRELVADKPGTTVGKFSARLRISRKGEVLQEVPLVELKQVFVTSSGVSFSSDALEECARRGIPVYFLDFAGRVYATFTPCGADGGGTVRTRREQLLAYTDARGLALAKAFAGGKICNQLTLLRYMTKSRENSTTWQATWTKLETLTQQLQKLAGPNIEAVRPQLLALEANASKLYWQQARELLRTNIDWKGRQTVGATDLINSLLNYGYGILYARIEQVLVVAGLDPYGGFIHTDRPGKPSLVYDFIEEFRQPVVDRTIFGLLNHKVPLRQEKDGRLDSPTRRLLTTKILERLYEGYERYEGNKQTLNNILQSQAAHIATFVRGERSDYKPFVATW